MTMTPELLGVLGRVVAGTATHAEQLTLVAQVLVLREIIPDRSMRPCTRPPNEQLVQLLVTTLAQAQLRSAELVAAAVTRRDADPLTVRPVQLVVQPGAIVVNVATPTVLESQLSGARARRLA